MHGETCRATAQSPDRQTIQIDARAADHLELALEAGYVIGPRYLTALERSSVTRSGRLLDGTPWELPLALRHAGDRVRVGDRVVLTDPEALPVAELSVEEAVEESHGTVLLAGPLTALERRSAQVFDRLRARLGGMSDGGLVVPTSRPLHTHDLEAARDLAEDHGSDVTLLGLVGAGRPHPVSLTRALLSGAAEISGRVAVLPVPTVPEIGPLAESRLVTRLVARYGAGQVMLPHESSAPPASALADLPVPVVIGPAGPLTEAALERLLDDGTPLPPRFTPEGVERELRRRHPPTHRRGLALLFTGLSGSGKSTLASAVVDALAEHSEREVTVLDGDVVRTMLSSGLTFSREHRETNIRRVGFVAAQVVRHGGTVVCALIAPYASGRQEIRTMVEGAGGVLVVVHVSTPLAVCAARDRKGLYVKARAGLIPDFTGVSDPYEVPDDADVRLDTSIVSVEAGVDLMMELLRQRGLVRD